MASPLVGQITTSGSAIQVTSVVQDMSAWEIKAPASNTSNVEVGDSTVTLGQGHVLCPGDSIQYERGTQNGDPQFQLRPSDFWAVGSGGKLSWLGSP